MDFRVIIILALEGIFALSLLWFSGYVRSVRGIIRCALLLSFALLARFFFFDKENTDYQWFLKVWVDFYRTNGGFTALDRSIGNYNIPYLYFLALFSYSSIRDLYLIKLLSIFFDVVLSFSGTMLVTRCTGYKQRGVVCFFLLFFLPTVFLNGAYWGQCDSIYVSLALLGLAFAIPAGEEKPRPALSMICIAASFGFKLQAVFLMPVWVLLWVWKKYDWKLFLLFPLTYLVLILPAVIAGRPLMDAVMLYADQAGTVGDALNYNAPSLSAILNPSDAEKASRILIIAAFAAMSALLLGGILMRKKLTALHILYLSTMIAMAIPFFLPHMHDRYFFASDALTCILACCAPVMIPASVFMQFGSLICYLAYFTGYYLRLGNTNIFLTNGKGTYAVILAMLIILTGFLYSFPGDSDPPQEKNLPRNTI